VFPDVVALRRLIIFFFTCGVFGSLWTLVKSWVGFEMVDPSTPSAHFT
jgi:hypothetical protein